MIEVGTKKKRRTVQYSHCFVFHCFGAWLDEKCKACLDEHNFFFHRSKQLNAEDVEEIQEETQRDEKYSIT